MDDPNEYLTPFDLATYELARARLALAQLKAERVGFLIEKEQREHQERYSSLATEREACKEEVGRQLRQVARLQAELGVRYSVDMAAMAYDDITGKISRL